jgi:hypothetical protein
MWVAFLEFFLWAMIGLIAGFAAHWWKANADPYPDIIDKDRPLMNMALTEYSVTNYALDHAYDEAGFWDYYSLRNLLFYLSGGVGSVLLAVYATAEGHALAREGLCKVAGVVGLVPVFCP